MVVDLLENLENIFPNFFYEIGGEAEKFIRWCHICCCWHFWLMWSKVCKIDERSVWTTRGTVTKNEPHLVAFCGCIFIILRTFQPTICGVVVIWYVAPTICGDSLLKDKRYKRRKQKNIHNKAIQTKIHLSPH